MTISLIPSYDFFNVIFVFIVTLVSKPCLFSPSAIMGVFFYDSLLVFDILDHFIVYIKFTGTFLNVNKQIKSNSGLCASHPWRCFKIKIRCLQKHIPAQLVVWTWCGHHGEKFVGLCYAESMTRIPYRSFSWCWRHKSGTLIRVPVFWVWWFSSLPATVRRCKERSFRVRILKVHRIWRYQQFTVGYNPIGLYCMSAALEQLTLCMFSTQNKCKLICSILASSWRLNFCNLPSTNHWVRSCTQVFSETRWHTLRPHLILLHIKLLIYIHT